MRTASDQLFRRRMIWDLKARQEYQSVVRSGDDTFSSEETGNFQSTLSSGSGNGASEPREQPDSSRASQKQSGLYTEETISFILLLLFCRIGSFIHFLVYHLSSPSPLTIKRIGLGSEWRLWTEESCACCTARS